MDIKYDIYTHKPSRIWHGVITRQNLVDLVRNLEDLDDDVDIDVDFVSVDM
jgi:hypothetical protein